MRQVYRARRDLVISLLGELLPDHGVSGIAAGLHVILELPSHAAASAVRMEAETVGIVVESLEQHSFAQYAGPAGLLIGYGGLSEPSLEQAVRRLAKVIRASLDVSV
jgi:GntR family transcriptional regulator/MocR family aminotransferase